MDKNYIEYSKWNKLEKIGSAKNLGVKSGKQSGFSIVNW